VLLRSWEGMAQISGARPWEGMAQIPNVDLSNSSNSCSSSFVGVLASKVVGFSVSESATASVFLFADGFLFRLPSLLQLVC